MRPKRTYGGSRPRGARGILRSLHVPPKGESEKGGSGKNRRLHDFKVTQEWPLSNFL